jgi:hypothetical protein
VPVTGRPTEESSHGESDRRRTGSLIINSVDPADHLVSLDVNGKKRTVRDILDTGSEWSHFLKKTVLEMG